MRIYLLLGHPDTSSFDGALTDAYEEAALAAGHEVRRHNAGDLHFDPVLHHGYNEIQDLEPDLLAAQQNIAWCEHWVLVYPVWWGSVPAILKGFFDRALTPGFAFHYHETDPMWDALLKGRSAQIITTSDAPNLWTLFAYRNSDLGTVKNAVLEFCGIRPVKVKRFDRMKGRSEAELKEMIEAVRKLVP